MKIKLVLSNRLNGEEFQFREELLNLREFQIQRCPFKTHIVITKICI